jgi:hypothetical protein
VKTNMQPKTKMNAALLLLFLCGYAGLAMALAAEDNALLQFQFATIGDWGGASLGGYHLKNVQQTAAAVAALDPGPAFVVNTGDSFYYCGIQNISDPQIAEDYTKVFQVGGGGGRGAPLLLWYSVLGNHDYGFAPEAQLELGKVIPGWVMDARYYWRRIPLSGSGAGAGAVINLIALDTSPCVNDYREDDPVKWDPCGKEFPTCAPQPGQCRFHENVLAQACEPQVAWLAAVLDEIRAKTAKAAGATEWTIVVGHHRADQLEFPARQFPFQALLDRPDVHLYLNGHVHSLEHYAINAQAKYVTSGAASMVVERGLGGLGGRGGRGGRGSMGRNAVSRVWSRMVTGYTLHAVNSTALTTEFRDAHTNKVIHEFTLVVS